jgi:hypothetical protein
MAFDKSSGESGLLGKTSLAEVERRGDFWGMTNDMDGGLALSLYSYESYDKDMLYASFDAYKMIEQLTPEHFAKVRSSVKYPGRLARLEKFVASLTEDDNPVLVIAHLK